MQKIFLVLFVSVSNFVMSSDSLCFDDVKSRLIKIFFDKKYFENNVPSVSVILPSAHVLCPIFEKHSDVRFLNIEVQFLTGKEFTKQQLLFGLLILSQKHWTKNIEWIEKKQRSPKLRDCIPAQTYSNYPSAIFQIVDEIMKASIPCRNESICCSRKYMTFIKKINAHLSGEKR